MDLMIPIDRSRKDSLVDQLYDGILAAIVDDTLQPGARLPSTRDLARQLGLTRFTVDDAYSRLVSEGYLDARHGSGTYVASRVRLTGSSTVEGTGSAAAEFQLSSWAGRLPAGVSPDLPPVGVDYNFLAGTPAFDLLPLTTWHRLIAREARRQNLAQYSYSETTGLLDLRDAIATWVSRSRGVACSPDQVIVTSGAQQSMDLVMRLVADPDSFVVVEDPCYRWVRTVAGITGATVHPVPVDAEGLQVDRLPGSLPNVRLVCVTPSHQYPTGGVLPLSRRLDLLAWARSNQALILEDDYDGELRYDSRPLPALAALANAPGGPANVIYMGSFSKVLFPAIRLGYLIVPEALVEPFTIAKATIDRHAPTLNQAVVAAFIREGHFERHIARMRRAYASRHDALVEGIATDLAGIACRDYATTSAGLHLMVRIDRDATEADLVERARRAGIAIEGAGSCFLTPPAQPHLFLGYANMDEPSIREGISRLARVFETFPRGLAQSTY